MQRLSFEEFEAVASAYDADVDRAPIPDRFCSASEWIVPARRAFTPHATSVIHRGREGWAPLMQLDTVLGRTWMPLESGWGLASSFVGAQPPRVARTFLEAALGPSRDDWDALFLAGLVREGTTFQAIVRRTVRTHRLGVGQPTVRCIASLEGGYDGFLSRRTPKFRKNLRRAWRKARGELRFEVIHPASASDALAEYDRILKVEARSWKGRDGHGIADAPMRDFYAEMVPQLAARGALRITYARRDGDTVGYCLGGLRGSTYRGLQMSYDASVRHLSVGNLLQSTTIEHLCAEGVGRYDLGTWMDYKRHWGEERLETVPLVVR